jgi:hypothetical protein
MAHKELKYDVAARRALEKGVDAVANAVKGIRPLVFAVGRKASAATLRLWDYG